MADVRDQLVFENCSIIFKNFSGKPSQYNRDGDRNFCVVIPDEAMAQGMLEEGWNVRMSPPREEGDAPRYYMSVKVSYENWPPKIMMGSGKKYTKLDEDTIDTVDFAEIKSIDLVVRPYQWNVQGKSGIKAYCKEMWITIVESAFGTKYDFEEDPEELPFD